MDQYLFTKKYKVLIGMHITLMSLLSNKTAICSVRIEEISNIR